MLAPKAQYNPVDAKKYFKEHLAIGDYYAEGQSVLGQWFGNGAEDLELRGITTSDEFARLCDNLHPQTGERLTLRQKTTRVEKGIDGKERETANRRVFYDFTFSPPKSVSIAALVGKDARIVEAHEQAVTLAMNQLQTFAATRVRKGNECTDRPTGNLVAAMFRHDTSRSLDPHLHTHCIVFNATFDSVEKQWKALQNHEMFVAQKFVENVYYHELTRELVKFGYQIKNKPRGDFEIQGVAPELIEKFSKRHREIDQKTKELLAREPEKADGNIATIRENIAHKERPRKIRDIGLEKLQTLWDDQMTAGERDSLNNLTVTKSSVPVSGENVCEQAVTWAEQHLFERRSIVHEHELWRHALERARGQDVSLADIQAVTQKRGYVRFGHLPGRVSTREHLFREWEIVQTVKEGIGDCHSLIWKPKPFNPKLDEEQREALHKLVSNIHRVSVFRGGAGTGKSFVLRELVGQFRDSGRDVVVLAPQRQQVLDMERDGFPSPATLASFLQRKELHEGAVVIVDEAGQIGGQPMLELLRLVEERGARLVLSGDTRQHGAVEAGDSLWAIEQHSGIRPVELTNIRRQNPALAKSIEERRRIKEYRQAVEEARDGKFSESFERLDKLKTIESCTLADKHEKLATRYLELVKARQTTVVVSQSWNEIHQVNEAVRAALKRDKVIGESEILVTAFQPVDMTNAQKRDARSYTPDTVLVFNRDVRGFKAGESARLKVITETHLLVETDTRIVPISFKHLDKLTACKRKELALASGDKLQLKANGRSVENRKLANGELVTVKAVEPDGRIALADGRVLDNNFRQFVRGYAITSYASQGKSVDYVLFSDSGAKAATSQQQWYVTISRGKKGIHIFTSDKEQLQENITRRGDQPAIMDILAAHYQNDPFYRLIEQSWGQRTAVIMTKSRRARQFRELRQRQAQERTQSQTPAETLETQSRSIRI
ncbi:MAG TPA: MobF family relaxase [Verrucomicrobiae bacterium]|nr:MobF family relaxase [Verrucomicrobiae bacterium]